MSNTNSFGAMSTGRLAGNSAANSGSFASVALDAVSSLRLPLAFVSSLLLATPAMAASYFVRDTAAEPNVNSADALIATSLVKNAVTERRNDRLSQLEYRASYVLQPRLIKLGDRYLLTVEKIHGNETLFAAQAKVDSIDELDEAAKSATFEAIDEPSKPSTETASFTGSPSRSGRGSGLEVGRDMNNDESEVAAPYSNLQPVDYANRVGQRHVADQGNQNVQRRQNYGQNASQNYNQANRRIQAQAYDRGSSSGTTSSADDGMSAGTNGGMNGGMNKDAYPDHGSSVDAPSSNTQQTQYVGRPATQQNQQSNQAAQSQSASQSNSQAGSQAYAPAQPAARSTTHAVDVIPSGAKPDHFNLGFGPFVSRQLGSDNVMYDIAGGYSYAINNLVSLKAGVEGAFSSGSDRAHFFNLSAGGSYFFPGNAATAPFLTGDIGYGFAQDAQAYSAEGFSSGIGGGVEFFRNQQTTLDLLIKYTLIFDNTSNQYGKPSILGARLALNF